MKTLLPLLILLFFLLSNIIFSQTEALDTTFGGTGMVQTDVAGDLDIPASMLIQPDGKILVAGICYSSSGTGNIGLVRYNEDGTLDNSFGVNGKVNTFASDPSDQASFMRLQPDGKILLGGRTRAKFPLIYPFDHYDIFLLRLNKNGSIDNTFGNDGSIRMDYQNKDNHFGGAHLQENGSIITVLYYNYPAYTNGYLHSGYLLQRYDINGNPDSTFGNQGMIIDTFQHRQNYNYQITFITDQKYILGTHIETDTSSCIILKRYDINGIIDSTFGNNGSITSQYLNHKDHFTRFLFQPDGKIFVIGETYTLPGMEDKRTLLLRYSADGQVDSAFGTNGRLTTPYEGFENNPVFVSNEQLLVSGGAGLPVYRFNTDGTLDETFGVNGRIGLEESVGMGFTMRLQPDGKIVVAGTSPILNNDVRTIDFLVVRYLSDFSVGVLDFKNKPENVLVFPNPISETTLFNYTLLQSENITLTLYDQTGRAVQSFFTNVNKTAGAHQETLHFNQNLPAGAYWLTFITSKGRVSIQVFKI